MVARAQALEDSPPLSLDFTLTSYVALGQVVYPV